MTFCIHANGDVKSFPLLSPFVAATGTSAPKLQEHVLNSVCGTIAASELGLANQVEYQGLLKEVQTQIQQLRCGSKAKVSETPQFNTGRSKVLYSAVGHPLVSEDLWSGIFAKPAPSTEKQPFKDRFAKTGDVLVLDTSGIIQGKNHTFRQKDGDLDAAIDALGDDFDFTSFAEESESPPQNGRDPCRATGSSENLSRHENALIVDTWGIVRGQTVQNCSASIRAGDASLEVALDALGNGFDFEAFADHDQEANICRHEGNEGAKPYVDSDAARGHRPHLMEVDDGELGVSGDGCDFAETECAMQRESDQIHAWQAELRCWTSEGQRNSEVERITPRVGDGSVRQPRPRTGTRRKNRHRRKAAVQQSPMPPRGFVPVRELVGARAPFNTDCPLCLDQLEEVLAQDRVPCMRRCRHAFCIPCILHWMSSCEQRRLEIRCPLCNCSFETESSGSS